MDSSVERIFSKFLVPLTPNQSRFSRLIMDSSGIEPESIRCKRTVLPLNDEPKRLTAILGTMIYQLAPNFVWSSLLISGNFFKVYGTENIFIFCIPFYKKLALMPRKSYDFLSSMYKKLYLCMFKIYVLNSQKIINFLNAFLQLLLILNRKFYFSIIRR